jgi:excisionase family DNA binding protein
MPSTPARLAASPRRLASLAEAAEYAAVNPRTVRRWITDGLITGHRVGARLIKVDLNEIDYKVIRPVPAARDAS